MAEEAEHEKFQRAMEALSQADFPAAIELLGEVVVNDSTNGEAWLQLGVCYLETQQPDLALEALTRAVEAAPEHATAHYVLGNAYGSTGNLERAAACYRRALEIDPDHAKAEEFLVKAESLLESRERYRAGLKLLYSAAPSAADLNRALRELVQSVAIFPESPKTSLKPFVVIRPVLAPFLSIIELMTRVVPWITSSIFSTNPGVFFSISLMPCSTASEGSLGVVRHL